MYFNETLLEIDHLRAAGQYDQAITRITEVIGSPTISPEVRQRFINEDGVDYLLSLARMWIDSRKGLARHEIDAQIAMPHLQDATKRANEVAQPELLGQAKTDNVIELLREVTKVADASSFILNNGQRRVLLETAIEAIDIRLNESRIEGPMRGLLGIEKELLGFRYRGVASVTAVTDNLELVKQEIIDNPDRVASVAIWVETLGIRMGNWALFMAGKNTLKEVCIQHPHNELLKARQKEGHKRWIKEWGQEVAMRFSSELVPEQDKVDLVKDLVSVLRRLV